MAQAGMIGTEALAPAAEQAERTTLLNLLGRSDVASQLQALGIDPAQAKDRVQAMSDQEIATLAGTLGSQPAGASDAGTVLVIILIVAVVWWFMTRPRGR